MLVVSQSLLLVALKKCSLPNGIVAGQESDDMTLQARLKASPPCASSGQPRQHQPKGIGKLSMCLCTDNVSPFRSQVAVLLVVEPDDYQACDCAAPCQN